MGFERWGGWWMEYVVGEYAGGKREGARARVGGVRVAGMS